MATLGDTQVTVMEARIEAFLERILEDLASTLTTSFCALGDRLGLFRALAEGAATGDELAERTSLDGHYVREWARGLYTAGYLDHDAETGRFSLPAEHAAVLADESSPAFLGGGPHMIHELLRVRDSVEGAFRQGGGIAAEAYGEGFWHGLTRLTGVDFAHRLTQEWIPAVAGLEERLRDGASVADVGCGHGVAAIKLAEAFPHAVVRGFDVYGPNVEAAREAARVSGVSDRVSFERVDAVAGIPGKYDLVAFFDVVHDSSDPVAILQAAREALRDGGVCTVLEPRCHSELEADQGPIGTLFYGLSLFHCTPQSLAAGGPGIGTCGLPEPRLLEIGLEAGFRSVEPVGEGPLDRLYALRL